MKSTTIALRTLLCGVLCASSAAALAKQEWGGTATGKGRIATQPTDANPKANDEFEAKFSMAVRPDKSDHVWLLVSDSEAPGYGWAAASNPIEVLRIWCEYDHAKWVLYDLDATGTPELAQECGSDGLLSTAMISTANGLASVAPTWEVFDGKVVRGRIRSGSGNCGDDYCENRGDYSVDVAVVAAPVIK